jgi:hypothetical protein
MTDFYLMMVFQPRRYTVSNEMGSESSIMDGAEQDSLYVTL